MTHYRTGEDPEISNSVQRGKEGSSGVLQEKKKNRSILPEERAVLTKEAHCPKKKEIHPAILSRIEKK